MLFCHRILYLEFHHSPLQVTHRLEELEWADGASYMDGGRVQVSA